jgi:hypothetical protein
MDSHFITVFDIAQKQGHWPIQTAVGFLLALAWLFWEWRTRRRFKYMMMGAVFAFISFVVGFGGYRDTTYGLADTQRALKEGRVSTIEGRVADFVPMPNEGHSLEQFTVSGVRFSYSDYVLAPCFNNTRSHGGPIHEGLWVRLSYQDTCILKIEVWHSDVTSDP